MARRARRRKKGKVSVRASVRRAPGISVGDVRRYGYKGAMLRAMTTTEDVKRIGDRIGVDWSKVDFEQFRRGLIVEMEHSDVTMNIYDIGRIAHAHLKEVPDYYTRLDLYVEETK